MEHIDKLIIKAIDFGIRYGRQWPDQAEDIVAANQRSYINKIKGEVRAQQIIDLIREKKDA